MAYRHPLPVSLPFVTWIVTYPLQSPLIWSYLGLRLWGIGRLVGLIAGKRSFQSFERQPLRCHSDVGVVIEHFPADVSGNAHDGLIAQARLGQLGDGLVAQIVKAESL